MKSLIRTGTGVALAAILVCIPAAARAQDTKKDIEALKQGQTEILKQLEELKKLVQAQRAPAAPLGPNVKDVVFNLGNNERRGSEKAKLTLVEFTDYQCPFCSRYTKDTGSQIEKDYVETGKLRYVKLDFPLPMHSKAMDAAEAARCAADQGKFWEMHERLFANQQALEPFNAHAEALGMKVPEFEECMKSDKYVEAIKADMKEGQKAGFTGTPSFMIALTDPKDPKKVKGIVAMVGAKPYDSFKVDLDKALASN